MTESIHEMQLRLTARLINRGAPIDVAIEKVLAKTRAAAGEPGKSWDWRKEKTKIRRLCEGCREKLLNIAIMYSSLDEHSTRH
jgi:hypothetical protein